MGLIAFWDTERPDSTHFDSTLTCKRTAETKEKIQYRRSVNRDFARLKVMKNPKEKS